jgi:UDP-glucose 4-epimerase
MHCSRAFGEVVNVGSLEEVTILDLATRIKHVTGSQSELRLTPYSAAYGEGFEDMQRRVPALEKVWDLIRWRPRRQLDEILSDMIQHEGHAPVGPAARPHLHPPAPAPVPAD